MFVLINKEGNAQRVTDKESKRDELIRIGYRLVEPEKELEQELEQEPEQGELGETKRRKRASQSTAAKKAEADKE